MKLQTVSLVPDENSHSGMSAFKVLATVECEVSFTEFAQERVSLLHFRWNIYELWTVDTWSRSGRSGTVLFFAWFRDTNLSTTTQHVNEFMLSTYSQSNWSRVAALIIRHTLEVTNHFWLVRRSWKRGRRWSPAGWSWEDWPPPRPSSPPGFRWPSPYFCHDLSPLRSQRFVWESAALTGGECTEETARVATYGRWVSLSSRPWWWFCWECWCSAWWRWSGCCPRRTGAAPSWPAPPAAPAGGE